MREGLSLTIKSVLVLIGFTLLILGAVEIGVAITGDGGSIAKGLPVLVLGAAIAGAVLYFAFRDMVNAEREDERLAAQLARDEKPGE